MQPKMKSPPPRGERGGGREEAGSLGGPRHDHDNKTRRARKLAEALPTIHAEAAGVLEVRLYPPESAPALLMAWADGQPIAEMIVSQASRLVAEIARGVRHLCIGCDRRLRGAAVTIVAVLPANAAASRALVTGGCEDCSERQLFDGADRWLREFWPELRALDRANVQREGGRA